LHVHFACHVSSICAQFATVLSSNVHIKGSLEAMTRLARFLIL
jgi:hypothetical protein